MEKRGYIFVSVVVLVILVLFLIVVIRFVEDPLAAFIGSLVKEEVAGVGLDGSRGSDWRRLS